MSHDVISRVEMLDAKLDLGSSTPLELADYAVTGLVAVALAPRGNGKTNAGLLIAEQLSRQGWVSVLLDPESELEKLYGTAVADPRALLERLTLRDQPVVVVSAKDAAEFVPYGRVLLEAAETQRKPTLLVVDEGQLFSATAQRDGSIREAAGIIQEIVERGRKRALDLFITAHRYTGTLDRSVFGNQNLLLVGCVEDARAWGSIAPKFRGSQFDFSDAAALSPGEFFCISRRGVEKIRMPLAKSLAGVAIKARPARRQLPTTFGQWDKAMRTIPSQRLMALTDEPLVRLLGTVAGLSAKQMSAGAQALADELELRS